MRVRNRGVGVIELREGWRQREKATGNPSTTAAVTGGGKGKRHTETNASEFYELADLRDGVWEVKVEATGYKKTQTTVEIRGERRHEHNLELTPKRSSFEVTKS